MNQPSIAGNVDQQALQQLKLPLPVHDNMHCCMVPDPVIYRLLDRGFLRNESLHDAPEKKSLLGVEFPRRHIHVDRYEGKVWDHASAVDVEVFFGLIHGEGESRDKLQGIRRTDIWGLLGAVRVRGDGVGGCFSIRLRHGQPGARQ